MKRILVTALAGAAFIASPAGAEVTYDPATGGFAGKGDVQSAFGWNNADLQANADDVTFEYEASADYEVTCTWQAGKSDNIQVKTSTISSGVSASITGSGRQKNQITGFNLGPAGAGGGGAPFVGASCGDFEGVDGSDNGTITSVTALGSSGGGGLYAIWNAQRVLLLAD